ncbi:MAG: LPS-assembly protein LptD [Elusimicrobia bacterium]|nr:LPS-assembly protein LptD [Elusimicrobiota bacterium]
MKLLLLLALGASAARAEDYPLPPPPAASTGTTRLDFVADHLDYTGESPEIHLKGGVKVQESTWTIKAEELWLDPKKNTGRSRGYLLMEDGVSAVYGDSGDFDFAAHSGVLYGSSAGHGDWRVHSKRVRLKGRRLDYYGADFTSCSYDPKPHYHFHATRLTVIPKKYLLARNAVFFLGPVPLLYSPVIFKSLKPKHWTRWRVQPGYDRRSGAFLKGTLTTELSPGFYSKLFLDYYSAQGLGAGAELEHRQGEDSRGSLFGYRIRETNNGAERWSVSGTEYRAFLSSAAFQGRLQVQSDADFNNHYSRSSLLRVTPELINSGALVYRLPKLTARLSYSRQDTASENRLRYLKAKESAPRLDLQSAQLRLGKSSWLHTFTGFADNSFDRGRTYMEKSLGGGWEGTRGYSVARGVSFVPKLSYREAYLNRFDSLTSFASTATVRDAFIGRYGAQGALTFATPAVTWNAVHSFERRQKPNSIADDAGAIDHGIETNLFTLEDVVRPHRKLLFRAFSGYDFRVFRDHSVGFRDRVQPLVAEVVYTPRSSLNFSVRDDYQLSQGNRSFLFNGQWGEENGNFLGAGAGYNLATGNRYFLSAEFGLSPSTGTWRLTAALRSDMTSSGGLARLSGFRLFEKEIALAKHWHDFYTRTLVRFRPGGVREASIRIDMKFASPTKESVPRRDWESEWFPERRLGGEDRP